MSGNVIPVSSLFRTSNALLPRGPERQYFLNDYDKGFRLQLIREGSCNGCGACCGSATQLQAAQTTPDPVLDLSDRADAQGQSGVWEGAEDGEGWQYYSRLVRALPIPCTAFGSDGRCRIHHVGKPVICQEWPMGPAQARFYPECSYWFKPIRAWHLLSNGKAAEEISLEGVL